MRGLPICAANKFAVLKIGRESRKSSPVEMGVGYREWFMYMDIEESRRQY
jgi:hypothetical protein